MHAATPDTPHTPLVALLGGSFNPVHIGHLRMALEVRDALTPERILIIPSANPPHKPGGNLLPFALRAEMLERAVTGLPGLEVCRIESERPGPSYTVDTLLALSGLYPKARLAFILGGEDFALLPTWNRWAQIPELADLIVLPRGNNGEQEFLHTMRSLWPGVTPLESIQPPDLENTLKIATRAAIRTVFRLPHGGRVFYLQQPRLEISSSLLRARWVQGRSLNFLMPQAAIDLLETNRDMATALWASE